MTIAPPRCADPVHRYTPPRLGEHYDRFRDVALHYGQVWDISYTGTPHGGVVYTATSSGVRVITDSLTTFAALLQRTTEHLPETVSPSTRVRCPWERRQAEQEARDLAAIASIPGGWSP